MNYLCAERPQIHTDCELLQLILEALDAQGRIPRKPPRLWLRGHFKRDNMLRFYLEEVDGGWVANIEFRDIPPGRPNTIGTPDARPLPCERSAFLAGAAIVCKIVTGSRKLPFFVAGDQLICTAYR